MPCAEIYLSFSAAHVSTQQSLCKLKGRLHEHNPAETKHIYQHIQLQNIAIDEKHIVDVMLGGLVRRISLQSIKLKYEP